MAALATRHVKELEPKTLKLSIDPLTSIARRNRFPVGSTNYIQQLIDNIIMTLATFILIQHNDNTTKIINFN